MNYEELRKTCSPALKEVARMGVWDGISIDVENGEPVVVAILQRHPIQKFLSKVGIMKVPALPERIHGIRCKVLLRNPAKNQSSFRKS